MWGNVDTRNDVLDCTESIPPMVRANFGENDVAAAPAPGRRGYGLSLIHI